jgi:hypothetical protein
MLCLHTACLLVARHSKAWRVLVSNGCNSWKGIESASVVFEESLTGRVPPTLAAQPDIPADHSLVSDIDEQTTDAHTEEADPSDASAPLPAKASLPAVAPPEPAHHAPPAPRIPSSDADMQQVEDSIPQAPLQHAEQAADDATFLHAAEPMLWACTNHCQH